MNLAAGDRQVDRVDDRGSAIALCHTPELDRRDSRFSSGVLRGRHDAV
jgi:hypothetical protein